jgi:hypothetical protein
MSRLSRLLRIPVTFLAAGVIFSCATVQRQELALDEEPAVVRVVSFRLGEGSEAAWSRACRRLAAAAMESHTDANWLIHRVDDRNYYLVSFGGRADLQDPNSIVEGFARRDVGVFKDEFEQLAAVPYRVSSDEVWEQVPAWGTTSDMNSLTHPGVDQRSYQVSSWQLAAVDSVLTDMASLLKEQDYPFPTEGFRVGRGADVTVHVISFFGARDEYYSNGRPEAFLTGRGKRRQWLKLVERLDAITHTRSRTASRYVHELSYDPWLLEQSPTGGG